MSAHAWAIMAALLKFPLFSFRGDKPKSKQIRLPLSGKVHSNFLHHISYSTKKILWKQDWIWRLKWNIYNRFSLESQICCACALILPLCQQLHLLLRMPPVAPLLMLDTSYTFSYACHQLHLFPRLIPVERFPWLGTSFMLPALPGLLVFSAVAVAYLGCVCCVS